ncbi:MAG: hypothetical protein BWY82_00895 [Verrucomicrobia bacterium ADurb.Bin474]|nr:MAG: hypothetical protein BWY82_00895 [Verrucomicrobia bacterium ADurb.Bin474]
MSDQLCKIVLEFVKFPALASDHESRTGRENLHTHTVRGTLDKDARHGSQLQLLVEILTDHVVLLKQLGKFLLAGKPTGLPVATDCKPKTNRIYFLSHNTSLMILPVR